MNAESQKIIEDEIQACDNTQALTVLANRLVKHNMLNTTLTQKIIDRAYDIGEADNL